MTADGGMPDITVTLASRKRPGQLMRSIESLLTQTSHDIEIIVGLDDDDPTAHDLPALPGVRYVVGPRPKTLGQLLNKLATMGSGRWLMLFMDDYRIAPGGDWATELLRAGSTLPREIGLLYFKDDLHPKFPTIPVISRRTYDTVGYYVSGQFPFWFTDTWWNEIAEFSGRKIELPVSVLTPTGRGKTHGMADLEFWVDFFEATRPRRVDDAIKLLRAAYGENSPLFLGQLRRFPEAERLSVQRIAFLHTPETLAYYKQMSDSPPGPHYAEVKSQAAPLVEQYRAARNRPAAGKSGQ